MTPDLGGPCKDCELHETGKFEPAAAEGGSDKEEHGEH